VKSYLPEQRNIKRFIRIFQPAQVQTLEQAGK